MFCRSLNCINYIHTFLYGVAVVFTESPTSPTNYASLNIKEIYSCIPENSEIWLQIKGHLIQIGSLPFFLVFAFLSESGWFSP